MDWIPALAVAVAALALFYLPGAAVALAGGLRVLSTAALAPALTLAVAGVGAVLADALGVPWGWPAALASTVIACAVAWVIGRRWPIVTRRALPAWSRRQWGIVGGVGVAAVAAVVIPAVVGMGRPDAVLQKWDGLFHLNLVQYIRTTHSGSTLTAGTIANPAGGYYPAAWHDVVALLPWAPSTVAVNMSALVTTTVVWVVSVIYLARVLFPAQPSHAAIGAALSAVYQATPSAMWGGFAHIPNAMGVAVLPALIAWTVQLARVIRLRRVGRGTRIVVLGVALVGGALAHPNTLFSYLVLASPIVAFVVGIVVRRLWRSGRRVLVVVGLGVLVVVVAGAAYLLFSNPSVQSVMAFERDPRAPTLEALVLGLMDSTASWHFGPNLAVLVLIVVGIVVTLQSRRRRWLVVSYGLALVLYAGAAGTTAWLRALTGLWYSDPVRLGSVLPVIGIPLCTIGLAWLWYHARFWLRRPAPLVARSLPAHWWGTALAATVCLLVVVVGAWLQVGSRAGKYATNYSTEWDVDRTRFLTTGEVAMISRLPAELEEGGVVLGDPFNGSAHIYGMQGIPTVFRHVGGSWDADRTYLLDHFADLGTDPQVCTVLQRLGVRYFYTDTMRYGNYLSYPGLDFGIDTAGTMRLVDSGDTARVYEITACD